MHPIEHAVLLLKVVKNSSDATFITAASIRYDIVQKAAD